MLHSSSFGNIDYAFLFTVFGKSIHSLSKIGDELYIEPLDHGVRLLLYLPSYKLTS